MRAWIWLWCVTLEATSWNAFKNGFLTITLESNLLACVIVPTDHVSHPFVAHAPTMRVPMNIQGTDHVYLAMWAALTAVHRHNRSESRQIQSVACPGLGTGTGGMDSLEAALQLCLAYEHHRRVPQFINPSFAQ